MIKLFSHYIRKILDSFRDSIRVIKHYDLIKLNGHIIIFKIFIIKFFYSFSFIRNFKKIIYRNEILNSDFFEKNLINIDEDLKQIDELGYSKIYNVKDKTKKKILDMVLNCENLDLKKIDFPISEILKKKNEELEEYLEKANTFAPRSSRLNDSRKQSRCYAIRYCPRPGSRWEPTTIVVSMRRSG